MKSLDEVIKAVHHCGLLSGFDDTYEYDGGCPYEDCSECEKKRMLGKDIIQYLAAYKDDKNELTALRAFWKEQHDNHPLDWDELRKMEGMPVWIEVDSGSASWCLVDRFFDLENDTLIGFVSRYGYIERSKNLQDIVWQAYRKERC